MPVHPSWGWLEVGRDGGSVTVPGRLVPLGTPTAVLPEMSPGPPSPPDPPGWGELVPSPRSHGSVPQFLSAHRGVTAQWGIQPRSPSLHSSATVPAPAPPNSLCAGGRGKEGETFGSCRDVSHPLQLGNPGPVASGMCLFAMKLSFGEIMLKGYL